MLSCGDLKSDYLTFLVTMGRAPLLYVHGNHDGRYKARPPEGCDLHRRQARHRQGHQILGLGGSRRYNNGEHQYTERQDARARGAPAAAAAAARRAGHPPHARPRPPGWGDAGKDLTHQGFEVFLRLLDPLDRPRYLIHGHNHPALWAQHPAADEIRRHHRQSTPAATYPGLPHAHGRIGIQTAFPGAWAPGNAFTCPAGPPGHGLSNKIVVTPRPGVV